MGDKNYSLMQNSMIEANTGFWTYARTTLEWLPVLDLPFAISHIIEDLERGDYRGAILNGGTELLPGPNVFRRFRKARNAVSSATRRAANAAEEVVDGARGISNLKIPVYRVYGGASRINGFSWTPINPKLLPSRMFRKYAGLPNTNWGTGYRKGQVRIGDILRSRRALPLDGNPGGLPEFIINPNNVNM